MEHICDECGNTWSCTSDPQCDTEDEENICPDCESGQTEDAE